MKRLFFIIVFVSCVLCFAENSSSVPPRYYVNPNVTYQLYPTENVGFSSNRIHKLAKCGWYSI